jgi:putative ABC transport system substrate-binding protein
MHVEAGGLLSYGPDRTDLYRRAAGYVDKILKGILKAGGATGAAAHQVRVCNQPQDCQSARPPPSLLARADEVIE